MVSGSDQIPYLYLKVKQSGGGVCLEYYLFSIIGYQVYLGN